MKLFRIIKRTIHGGTGYDTGDGCDIEDKVIEFFINKNGQEKFVIVLSTKIETKQNIYIYNLFGYKWIKK